MKRPEKPKSQYLQGIAGYYENKLKKHYNIVEHRHV